MTKREVLTVPESGVMLVLAIEQIVTLGVILVRLEEIFIDSIAALLELSGHRAVHVPDETVRRHSADAGCQGGEGEERYKGGCEHVGGRYGAQRDKDW